MGKDCDQFIDIVYEIAVKYAPGIPRENISINNSSGKKFISINVVIYATCIEQIHGIYDHSHPTPWLATLQNHMASHENDPNI